MLNTNAYKKLLENYQQISTVSLLDLFAMDKNRANKFTLDWQDLKFDFSKNNITEEILNNLIKLANESDLPAQIQAMVSGKKINNTENRAVLHTALRAQGKKIMVDGKDVSIDISVVLEQMRVFSEGLHNGSYLGYSEETITDIVNIGIGGSDLGPLLVCQALKPYRKNNLNIHFVSSVDGYQILDTLSNLHPETTLFVIASKTFTTEETITNANTARKWFLAKTGNNLDAIKQHFVACSTNKKAVMEFGIDPKNMFEFWDFVGGRYSLWSAIGLPIVLYIGFDNFLELLNGARAIDEHFINTTELNKNLPVVMALISIWYINFFNYSTRVILPYNTRLSHLPDYLQQLQMESNGKAVDKMGNSLHYKTCPVIWGGSGINGQHAYFQLLHQGTTIHPIDFIVAMSCQYTEKNHNDIMVANVIAQAEAFMQGKTIEVAKNELLAMKVSENEADFLAKHKVFRGNRPSNMLILPEISPYYLGALIALYEHKTFVEGVVWQINSFDQWGVELGKALAKTALADIQSGAASKHDASTQNLINMYIDVK